MANFDYFFRLYSIIAQSGYEAIQTAVEEMIHHRGQLCTYLRLLEVESP